MKRNTLFSFLTVAALGLLMAGPASAADATWEGDDSDNYGTGSNWSTGSVPGSGDTATINAVTGGNQDPVLDDANYSLGRVLIGSGGKLTITGNTLTLDGTTAHDIRGDLVLSNATAVLKISDSVTVSGAGNIKGEHNDAQVQIAANKVLTNSMSMVGQMTIVGQTPAGPGNAGKLDNRGAVVADALNGILELGSDLLLASTVGSGRWEASGQSSAVLLFSNAHTCALLGDFRVGDCATIQFNVDIDTEGSLSHDATNNKGTIDVENGSTFGYSCNTADPCVCTDITTDTTLGCP